MTLLTVFFKLLSNCGRGRWIALKGGRTPSLISPYGGKLVDLFVNPDAVDDLIARAVQLPSLVLTERALFDFELLACGAFSPLDRFMGEEDFQHVLEENRLTSGNIFPIPVILSVEKGPYLKLDQEIALRDARNELLAVMMVEEIFEWDPQQLCDLVFGTRDLRHPLVAEMHRWGSYNISGRLLVIRLPQHHDFQELRLTPAETRAKLNGKSCSSVVAFQTRNPLHRVHEELTKRAIQQVNGVLLLHPVVGMTKIGDVDHYTRVRTYKVLASQHYDPNRVVLALLPLAMRLAGPREALWHAVIRRNYGANYIVVGRDHASPGVDSRGQPFYEPYEAQAMVEEFSQELGVGVIPFKELVYLPDEDKYVEIGQVPQGTRTLKISGTEARDSFFNAGRLLPDWFSRPEVAEILSEAYPPKYKQGVCVWFTGLSGSGKSTTAAVLTVLLQEVGRQVTVLDGDVVRTHLSKGLGFSKEDRDTNVRRIGFVASEIVRHGGIAICAAVSPYRATRNDVRSLVGKDHYVEVFVDTPIDVCEGRDTKGLYAKARRGEIIGFTGIDDPYEAPEHAEVVLDTVNHTLEENARIIIKELQNRGFIKGQGALADQ